MFYQSDGNVTFVKTQIHLLSNSLSKVNLLKKTQTSFLTIAAVFHFHLFSSCGADKALTQLKRDETPPLNLNYHVLETDVRDGRSVLSEGNIKIPVLSKPNTTIMHVPELTDSQRQIIVNTIAENTLGKGTPIKVVVLLLDGYQEFSATWSSERERGAAQIQISLIDSESGKVIGSCNSTGDYFVQSIDSTQKRMEEVYHIALKSATKHCLRSLNEGMTKMVSE